MKLRAYQSGDLPAILKDEDRKKPLVNRNLHAISIISSEDCRILRKLFPCLRSLLRIKPCFTEHILVIVENRSRFLEWDGIVLACDHRIIEHSREEPVKEALTLGIDEWLERKYYALINCCPYISTCQQSYISRIACLAACKCPLHGLDIIACIYRFDINIGILCRILRAELIHGIGKIPCRTYRIVKADHELI